MAIVGGRMRLVLGVVALTAGLVACSGDSKTEMTPTPAPTDTPATATLAPTPTPTQTPTAPRHIVLDTSPKQQPPEVTRAIGPPPSSTFPPWDGKSTVIYDNQTGKALDLGPGSQPASFSPDGTKAAWAAGGKFAEGTEVFVVDLPSGQPRSLGPGWMAQFIDNATIVMLSVGGYERTIVDVVSGARRPYAGEPFPASLLRPAARTSEGFAVEPANPDRDSQVRTYTVRDAGSGSVLLTFDAASVTPAGKGELAAAAPPVDGQSNVYLIDIRSGAATYVASARPDVVNWPFSATADSVLWVDGYCVLPRGQTTLFDRKSGQLVRFDTGGSSGTDRWMLLTPGGLLAAGSFGATVLIDPATATFKVVIPGRPDGWAGDVSWSADYRYASHGPYGGHGGIC